MSIVRIKSPDGQEHAVEFQSGATLMEVALAAGISGIEAVCGGNCSCATCHVYIDPEWTGKLPALSEDENDLLEGTAAGRSLNSRLSCQIKLTQELDQLAVKIADIQS